MATLIGYDDVFLQHRTGEHPERPARVTSIVQSLKKDGYWDELIPVPTLGLADPMEWIQLIHQDEYIQRIEANCDNDMPFIDSPECTICPDSYNTALQAVRITLKACDMVVEEVVENGFCALRPPGHHAESDRSMGFCLFNNVAVAARYLQKKHGLKKILILDWDAHHGNGTQNSFFKDNTVLYCSLHQHPATLFPGTGWPHEFGEGIGRGFTLNLTMEPDDGDKECLEYFHENFMPVARDFNPDFVLISAGFDSHRKDPLSQLNMSENGFNEMTVAMKAFARQYCKGRMLSLLEGGYHIGALGSCVVSHVKLLLDES